MAVEAFLHGVLRSAQLPPGGLVAAISTPQGDAIARAGSWPVPLLGDSTLVHLGSVTKAFTGMALATVFARGEAKPQDPVAEYLPDVAVPAWPDGTQMTLLHLATHMSGLGRHAPGTVPGAVQPYAGVTRERLLQGLEESVLLWAPGTRAHYSDFGYAVLGVALENITGKPLADVLRERITGPLEMNDTTTQPTAGQRARRALGHAKNGRPLPPLNLAALEGAGGLYSTAADLLRLLAAARSSSSGKEADRAVQTSLLLGSADWAQNYYGGLGWLVSAERLASGHNLRYLNGSTPGTRTWLSFDPGTGSGVVLLGDRATPEVALLGKSLARTLSLHLMLQQPPRRPPVRAPIFVTRLQLPR